MREIIFRAKRKDNGEWIYGDLVHWWGRHNTKPDIQIYNNVQRFNVIPETVGQFTGLTDKNGKRIFEGDIVEWIIRWEHNINGVKGIDNVIYKNNHFELEHEPPFLDLYGGEGFIAEVIGNIHENPELLGDE